MVSFEFKPEADTIEFKVECWAQRLPCPACGALDQPMHDRLARHWQHLHFFQFRAFIDARLPRVAGRERQDGPGRSAVVPVGLGSFTGALHRRRQVRVVVIATSACSMTWNHLGQKLPTGAIQEARTNDHGAPRWHRASRLSNGFVGSMNAQIQAAKARAKGYATTARFITIVYLLCAKLKHLPTNPWIDSAIAA